jgi:hypothetical protein
MNLSLLTVMASQHGLATVDQARDLGLTHTQIQHLVRTGALVPVRRGVYADGEHWRALDDRGRDRLRTRAATMRMRRDFVISHDSAAHEHGLEILLPSDPYVHITRPGSTNAWTKYGVKHHLARFSAEQVVMVDELRVLNLARTAVDIARELGEPFGEIACDAVLRRGVSRSELEAACAVMTNWPHVGRTRRAIAFANAGAANLAETLGRILVAEALGATAIDTQFPVPLASGRLAWLDMIVGAHGFEVDGHIKLRSPDEGGVAEHPAHEVVWAEKKRDRDLAAEGLGMSHIIWKDFWPPHRASAVQRIREEHVEVVARFGEVMPERLARQAREIRGRLA